MNKPLGSLEIIRSQRDSLAVAYHDLQVEHTLLKDSFSQANELLGVARARIIELERLAVDFVKIAGDADTDAAA